MFGRGLPTSSPPANPVGCWKDAVPEEALLSQFKRFIVGKPIPSHLAHHERLSRVTGLAVLSSDALSSVAYATEEILRVLVLVGVGVLGLANPIAVVIAAILAVVVFSYRQTIHAYPTGGGAYLVSKDNLGEMPALIAAAALLIDYILTVAVSIAAGVAAITSAFPQWHVNRVELTLGFVLVLTIGNLRGIRESGRIFAVPTYFFIVSILTLIGIGSWRFFFGTVVPISGESALAANQLSNLTLLSLLIALSNGCMAMTGVEAFSNGIVMLSVFAGLLLIAFHGDTQSLLPLYMIGVFVSFTLSQTGMVIHWRRLRETGWKTSALVNGIGAVVTAVVLVIVAITKALEGAWIIILLIPCL